MPTTNSGSGWLPRSCHSSTAPSQLRPVQDRVAVGPVASVADLLDHPYVVGREALIETVWRRAFVGSNVVDTVIRTLRKKLGPMRDCIQTVPKAGYRFIAPPA